MNIFSPTHRCDLSNFELVMQLTTSCEFHLAPIETLFIRKGNRVWHTRALLQSICRKSFIEVPNFCMEIASNKIFQFTCISSK